MVGAPLLDAVGVKDPVTVVVLRFVDALARLHIGVREDGEWRVGHVEAAADAIAWRAAHLRAVETNAAGSACLVLLSRPGAGDETEVDLLQCLRQGSGWKLTWRLAEDLDLRHHLRTLHPGLMRLPGSAEVTPLRSAGLPVIIVSWRLDAAPVMRGESTRRLRCYHATLKSDGQGYHLGDGEFEASAFETCWRFLSDLQNGRLPAAGALCANPDMVSQSVALGLSAPYVTWLGLTQRANSEVQEFYHGTRGRFRLSLTRNGERWTISAVERASSRAS